MVNKLWYKGDYSDSQLKDLAYQRNYIQKFIDLYCPELFNVPEDITPDNLQQFLEIILKHYEYYHFNSNELINLCENIDYYFYEAYEEEFPECFYPKYSKIDRRELVLFILSDHLCDCGYILPEHVPFLIASMNVPDDKIVEMYDKIDKYFDQFNSMKLFKELQHREELIKKQRKAAIETGQPLPIRPMGRELDYCYLVKLNQQELLELISNLCNVSDDNRISAMSLEHDALCFNGVMMMDLDYYIREKKLSPEEILEKVQIKNLENGHKVPNISDELKTKILNEPDVLEYDIKSNNQSKLNAVAKKYYTSSDSIHWRIKEDRDQ